MKLAQLLNGLTVNPADLEIRGLCLDSRNIQAGDAFVALNGAAQHGIAHAEQAVAKGAIAVIYDPGGADIKIVGTLKAPCLAITGLSQKLGEIAAKFYGNPSQLLAVIGVTGTNGKTTCSQLIAQALPACGVIGTLGWGDVGSLQPTSNTTPDALAVQQMLSEFVKQSKRNAAMEVSSHGLHQGRVNGVSFKGAVFTNLSRDHLDYHGSMAKYLQAKLTLFKTPGLQFAVVNLDDANSAEVLQSLPDAVQCWTYSATGMRGTAKEAVSAEQVKHSAAGIEFDVIWQEQRRRAKTSLVGGFNLDNVLAVLCVLLATGSEFDAAITQLAKLTAIPGRMEKFGGNGKPTIFVDYAHSPDALEKVLKAVKGANRLRVVFGCGGDRDKGKRPQMGKIAETWADQVIVTDDNPRSEAPAAIIKDILSGCQSQKITVINDRTTAINTVIRQADPDDCVVIAGKGHENYQEIGGVKQPFSDSAVVKQALAAWSKQ
ncbi:UDP-N-acetylmuramoyl-L-alanyl-D-glutamate--2,6-diaminopimelate ligase [Methylomonas fluvii]|uniref:UDP-N-acetylmuramoyl-L-alanyl-D-glutamate--2,6-diaminopimelate ligase n=1 Tax=Methylomonas fluvii TaxID=1854564 RepID=A0ABR9D813_9GAMM|nr:UDP-N-acetylmuramoyl-L-alanyl-D-glutamate--2,6-diaminopimelate ligase [Methylomonas fluvii]MBD9359252.1 UDP-N-acetylmuramoyl-L-alanyl-D-glutamate--2,6-diaminopimelate ligase [Methylomonas fluvii]CAD6871954.1 UDP-N-acetylmuramoylalanyl-D-glutamate--2,6-diaminopimelate ligase (EC 6.3.2.13) [Methylomonas fluvii]